MSEHNGKLTIDWLPDYENHPFEAEQYDQETQPEIFLSYTSGYFSHKRMLLAVMLAISVLMILNRIKPDSISAARTASAAAAVLAEPIQPEIIQAEETKPDSPLAPFFTAEVKHWTPEILNWSSIYDLDPNLVAIIMQVESCGDPGAVSAAGAQGLFQVMPFHFASGEDGFHPDTNAHRGLSYFRDRLTQTHGDIGLAFAGYNGGHVAADSSWDYWAFETRSYYVWTTGIYQDVTSGQAESNTLQRWLQAGGASLCQQAASRLGL